MKLFAFAAAGLAMLAGLTPVAPAAAAAPQRHYEGRTVVQHRTVIRNDRHGLRTRKVCRVERRRGNRVRICRTVRR